MIDIKKESQRFVRDNRGLKLGDHTDNDYLSPRVSSEFMDCSMPMTFDHFSHCSLGCTYCFAYFFKTFNSNFNQKLHSVNHRNIIQTIEGNPKHSRDQVMYDHFFHKKFLLHWGGLADPFCNFEKTNPIGLKIIEALGANNYPTLFSFKGSAIWRPAYRKVFEKHAEQRNFAFQVSIITLSDKVSSQVEIGVPVTSKRIKAIKLLSDMGYYTTLRLRPFIIGISDEGLEELLEKSLEAGIGGVSMEFFAMDNRASDGLKHRYKWLAKYIGVDDLHSYFRELSPSERGGYMRLNRLVKEPYVKTVYQFCRENDLVFGCSDPDFKELNTSGSCCAMPDRYEPNKLLTNWTKNQLTYALKEARRLHHMKGRVGKLYFDRVFRPEEDTYLMETALSNDHIVVSNMSATERKKFNYYKAARRIWNNLRSPQNPRNYFHGKVLPVGIDSSGDLVYVYQETEYEKRWKNEGIDLTY